MRRLSLETIVAMHDELIAQTGGLVPQPSPQGEGSPLDGVRDSNMLDASVNSPFH